MKKIIEYIKLFVYESKLKRSKKRILITKNKIKKNKEYLEKLNKKLDMQNKKYDKCYTTTYKYLDKRCKKVYDIVRG